MGGRGDDEYRMWGGRFEGRLDPRLARFTASLPVDVRLLLYDLRASLAHARMLTAQRIIPEDAGAAISAALRGMLAEAEAEPRGDDPTVRREDAEDVHTYIEAALHRRVGDAAGWLHTARSRNDQVVTAFRLWVKDACLAIGNALAAAQEVLLQRGEQDGDAVLPAYTHLQRAQPLLLGHHLLAYVWMLGRDAERVRRAYDAADVLPLGSGAAVGVSHPVDRELVARLLGFSRISENSLDATSDRDFAVELTGALALLATHLSRWAGEIVLWSTEEFGFASLPDTISTGSSIMPQKRNPDPAELIRGRAARVTAHHLALLELLRGLPLGYHRDLQEDKALVFEAVDGTLASLEAARIVMAEVRFHPERMRGALAAGFPTATEVSDYLVTRGVPFRQAHRQAGAVVRYAEGQGRSLAELSAEEWSALIPGLDATAIGRLQAAVGVEAAVRAKDVPGGTAPGRVAAARAAAAGEVRRWRAWVQAAEAREHGVREALRASA